MWQTIFRCGTRAALSGAAVLLLAWIAFRLPATGSTPEARTSVTALTLLALLVVVARALWPLTRRPSDARVARFIEERCPQLEDRLVTAVERASSESAAAPSMLAGLLYRDAARRAAELDLDRTISRHAVARRGAAAVASALLVAGIGIGVGPHMREGALAARGLVSPPRLVLHVSPGDAKIAAGALLRVEVRIDNASSDRVPELRIRDRSGIVRRTMTPEGVRGRYQYTSRPGDDLMYSVSAGAAASRDYRVTVLRPASVAGIDVHYQYPPSLGLAPRTEANGGDIYAPAGTKVDLRIHTDGPVRGGSLLVAGAAPAPLVAQGDRLLAATLTVAEDGSYRVGLTGADGLENAGDTEYYIRMLTDTPPDVRIVQPASDREVTPLEEVTIAAHADDDHGVKEFDLVYSVRGGPETAVPFATGANRQSIDGQRVLYLEDLRVRPGDFVTYYARARDAANGVRGNEARSDLFFLQVTPFEQEFMPPQSQASSGGMGAPNHSLDELVKAQKEIIVATWRLDRRSRKSRSSGSEADVKTIARAQGDLKNRAIDTAGPGLARASAPDTGRRAPGGEKPAEGGDAMANAIDAMGTAEQSLDAVDTAQALPHETRALNELLKAQASNRRWQMQAASAAAGADAGASSQDLTSLFDQALKREQQTNYEMPRASQQRDEQKKSEALERVRQMAQRQAGLAKQQEELSRDRAKLSEDEVKRQLQRLTREQSELRQQAEELAQQMGRDTAGGGQKAEGGGQKAGSGNARHLRDAADAMGQAASNLRDGKPGEASTRSGQALDRLRSAEQQMRQGGPGAPALGDLQMAAQQAADAQRQIARDAESAAGGQTASGAKPDTQAGSRPGEPTMRRLAGEKERLADQVEQLARGLKTAASSPGLEGRQRQAIEAVNKDLDRLQLPKQMRDQAAAMRTPEKADVNRPPSAGGEQDLAKTLGRIADRLGAAAGSRDTQQASEQLGETRDIRDRLQQLERQMDDLRRQAKAGATDSLSGRASATDSRTGGQAVGTSGGEASSAALERLEEEYARELRRAADHLDRVGREGGGAGVTPARPEAMSPLSAPGFHQDFSNWQQLSREIDDGLERAETALTKKLRDQQARDRLQAPSSRRAPEQYRRLVEQYYQSLAKKQGR
jgi:hypothetical protein